MNTMNTVRFNKVNDYLIIPSKEAIYKEHSPGFLTELFNAVSDFVSGFFNLFNSSAKKEIKGLEKRLAVIVTEPKSVKNVAKSILKPEGTFEAKQAQHKAQREIERQSKEIERQSKAIDRLIRLFAFPPEFLLENVTNNLQYIKGMLGSKNDEFLEEYNKVCSKTPEMDFNRQILLALRALNEISEPTLVSHEVIAE